MPFRMERERRLLLVPSGRQKEEPPLLAPNSKLQAEFKPVFIHDQRARLMAIIFIQVPVFQPTRRDLFAALAPPRTPNSIWASCQPELGSLGSLYSPSKLVPGQIRTHTSRATEGERHTWRAPSAVAYIIHYSGFGPDSCSGAKFSFDCCWRVRGLLLPPQSGGAIGPRVRT